MRDLEVTNVYRSVLICHRGHLLDQEGVSRWLGSFTELAGIVELAEPPGRTVQRIRKEVRRSGRLRFLDVLGFRLYYRLVLAAGDRAWEIAATSALRERFGEKAPCTNVLQTQSPNSAECVEFLRACRPDLVVARCKTLLKPEVFEVPARGTYVLHPGICPEYRNAHGCFWALARRDLTRVGLTLLRIDAGVDTGPIYGHYSYPFDEVRESHVVVQHRVLTENLDVIRDRLLEAVSGQAAALDTRGRASGVWGQPWLSAYLRWKHEARRTARVNADAALS
jgi:folate-dependent phosphoribosylglycinamide formyltransferase PurN